MKKTIAIFTGYYLPHLGGVERYVSKLSKELANRGYSIIIVTTKHQPLPTSEFIEGSKIYRLPIYTLFKNRYPIPHLNVEYRTIMNEINQEAIDYIILNTRFHLTSLIGARMAKRKKIEPLLIEHGTAHFTVGSPMLDIIGRYYEHFLTSIVKKYVKKYYGVSKRCNEWLIHFGIKAEGVFYNSIDPADSENAGDFYVKQFSAGEMVITYAGRLIKEKGVLNLIEAFRLYKKNHPNTSAKLLIAGDGPQFEDVIEAHELDPSILALGRLELENMKALYRRTDIFVYPSLYPEGLPTSILEAAHMGCAIIATPRGGTEEVIVDGDHGIIIDGTVESIYRSLEVLIGDKIMRQSVSEMAKLRVEQSFSWPAVADRIEEELSKLKKIDR